MSSDQWQHWVGKLFVYSGDTPVIVNVSDAWDSRIERMDLAPGDYVVRGSVYNSSHDGWYRLTIREDD